MSDEVARVDFKGLFEIGDPGMRAGRFGQYQPGLFQLFSQVDGLLGPAPGSAPVSSAQGDDCFADSLVNFRMGGGQGFFSISIRIAGEEGGT